MRLLAVEQRSGRSCLDVECEGIAGRWKWVGEECD
jgi:hypothetical protein